ncbi:MAG: hypothetical protein NXH94_15360 [Rhodobacteraceae bacterium]|uniref:hypothetical protein n=1 Tax=Marivita sp. TaxID=2003365 RepID=UPI003B52DE62|nr:hypothetical protein [Paracoccaceae bacterium]
MISGEILILEDDALIALGIEDTLANAGYDSFSVHSGLKSALHHIEENMPVAALLDFNLGKNETSLPVAEVLKNNGVPFLFLTGYTSATVALPDRFSDVIRLAKPFSSAKLVSAFGEIIS